MTQYFTNFSEHTTGAQPSDWTERWNAASSDWTVESEAGADGGQVLKHVTTGSARRLLSWDAVDSDANRADFDILVKGKSSSSTGTAQLFVMGRGAGTGGSETAYVAAWKGGASNFEVSKFVNGTFTRLVSGFAPGVSWEADKYFWIRFRGNSTSLKAKLWEDGQSEPSEWFLETTDSSITAAGWIGLGCGANTDGPRYWDYIGVGTDGDMIPSPGGGGGGGGTAGYVLVNIIT